jgi:hypothetical protein
VKESESSIDVSDRGRTRSQKLSDIIDMKNHLPDECYHCGHAFSRFELLRQDILYCGKVIGSPGEETAKVRAYHLRCRDERIREGKGDFDD